MPDEEARKQGISCLKNVTFKIINATQPSKMSNRRNSLSCIDVCNHNCSPCQAPLYSLPLEAKKVYEEEQRLLLMRDCLRDNIRSVRKSTVDECSKILDTIISYCECQASCKPEPRTRR
ncbi:unnamed protein product, partial [Candidula unifasciata]